MSWAWGFVVGLFLGGSAGFITAALLAAAHRDEGPWNDGER